MGRHPDSYNSRKVWVEWLSCLVPGSAKLIFPGTNVMEHTFLVASSNIMELKSPQIDLSEANRKVYNSGKEVFGVYDYG